MPAARWVTVVRSGARAESLDGHGHGHRHGRGQRIRLGTLASGQGVHNGPDVLPLRHVVRNLSGQTLVMAAVELRAARPDAANVEKGKSE